MLTVIKIHVLGYSAFSQSWPNNIEHIFSSSHHIAKKLVVDRKYIFALYVERQSKRKFLNGHVQCKRNCLNYIKISES